VKTKKLEIPPDTLSNRKSSPKNKIQPKGQLMKQRIRVVVFGGRHYENEANVLATLDKIHKEYTITQLIEGGASGADRHARLWAQINKIHYVTVPADWKSYGKDAGGIRNGWLLDLKPDLAIGFPGGKGTANMIRQVKVRRVTLYLVDDFGNITVGNNT